MAKKITDELEIEIRDEFIHGYIDVDGVRKYPTIDALVKRHDVSRTRLYTRAQKEDWQGQKKLGLQVLMFVCAAVLDLKAIE